MNKKMKKIVFCISLSLFMFLAIIFFVLEIAPPHAPVISENQKKVNYTKAQMSFFGMALELFKKDIGRYPAGEEGLQALFLNPNNISGWKGPYLIAPIPPDSWGNAYVYHCPGRAAPYEIISYGADGEPGGDGEDEDIVFVPGKEWNETKQ